MPPDGLQYTHTGFSLQPVTYIWPFHSTATILFVFIPHCRCIIYIFYLPNSKLNKERIWKRHPTEADHANMYSAEVKTLRACNNGVSVVSLQAVNRQHGCLVVVLLQNGSFRLSVFRMTARGHCRSMGQGGVRLRRQARRAANARSMPAA